MSDFRYLLGIRADINAANKDDASTLYAACFDGHFAVAELLIEAGVNVDSPNNVFFISSCRLLDIDIDSVAERGRSFVLGCSQQSY